MRAAPNTRLYWIGALACLTALVYWPSTVFLYKRWSAAVSDTDTYSHGWLILLIYIGLVVRARHDLAAAPVRPSPLAAVVLDVPSRGKGGAGKNRPAQVRSYCGAGVSPASAKQARHR